MKPKKIVTIGGGTGSFTLLSGLKKYDVDISAIVSMADDGGSTGILRDELGVLPPGDVRQCLVALSDSSEMLRRLMSYRFEEGGLAGHNFGNLFLSALEKINKNFSKGVQEASRILNVKGNVIPVTDQDTNLFMELKNGKKLKGENEINHNFEIEKIGINKNYLFPRAKANRQAIEKILEADLIVIGPGNHYCSIIPNLLVDGIASAIKKSKAIVVYNCNLVNKSGHTEKFDLDAYVAAINEYIGKDRIDLVTFNVQKPTSHLVKKYASQGEALVPFDEEKMTNRTYRILRANVLSGQKIKYSLADRLALKRTFIRHDSDKLAKLLIMTLELGEYEHIIKEII
ncbi:MAG: YvcK family protein [Candidatus Moranbacteria bacterium]|nr:YvcK family protein [Candidatus Moranbacteria bacterium]